MGISSSSLKPIKAFTVEKVADLQEKKHSMSLHLQLFQTSTIHRQIVSPKSSSNLVRRWELPHKCQTLQEDVFLSFIIVAHKEKAKCTTKGSSESSTKKRGEDEAISNIQ